MTETDDAIDLGEFIRYGRIVPEAIPRLFNLGLVDPIQGFYFQITEHGPCGCLLGGLHVARYGVEGTRLVLRYLPGGCWTWSVVLGERLGLDPDYAQGAAEGWEGLPPVDQDSPRYLAGHADGRTALLAVKAARPAARLRTPAREGLDPDPDRLPTNPAGGWS
jgi:hypothetical protein